MKAIAVEYLIENDKPFYKIIFENGESLEFYSSLPPEQFKQYLIINCNTFNVKTFKEFSKNYFKTKNQKP